MVGENKDTDFPMSPVFGRYAASDLYPRNSEFLTSVVVEDFGTLHIAESNLAVAQADQDRCKCFGFIVTFAVRIQAPTRKLCCLLFPRHLRGMPVNAIAIGRCGHSC